MRLAQFSCAITHYAPLQIHIVGVQIVHMIWAKPHIGQGPTLLKIENTMIATVLTLLHHDIKHRMIILELGVMTLYYILEHYI